MPSNDGSAQPWVEAFRAPPFVGDMVNQQMVPAAEAEEIVPALRVSLPTLELAKAWDKR